VASERLPAPLALAETALFFCEIRASSRGPRMSWHACCTCLRYAPDTTTAASSCTERPARKAVAAADASG